MSTYVHQRLGDIVTGMHQAAAVFEKFDLDFCCRGKQTLEEACLQKGIPVTTVETALEAVANGKESGAMVFEAMRLSELVDYIVLRHHKYVKLAIPGMMGHLEKVSLKHGDRFPYMKEVLTLFRAVQEELISHLQKEEKVLFPRIKEMEAIAGSAAGGAAVNAASINMPVRIMEEEHEHAGELLAAIRSLTHHYAPPPGACNTFRVTLAELKAFEEDLHQHVHLENNILFPKAIGLANTMPAVRE